MIYPEAAIVRFNGKYRWLSNFWEVPGGLRLGPRFGALDPNVYPTVEHAYQATKTVSLTERTEIAETPSPGQAKRLGRKVALRSDFSDWFRVATMKYLLEQKFYPGTSLAEQLIDTGEALIFEGDTWGDMFFGIDLHRGGVGENRLGQLLMDRRMVLRLSRRRREK